MPVPPDQIVIGLAAKTRHTIAVHPVGTASDRPIAAMTGIVSARKIALATIPAISCNPSGSSSSTNGTRDTAGNGIQ